MQEFVRQTPDTYHYCGKACTNAGFPVNSLCCTQNTCTYASFSTLSFDTYALPRHLSPNWGAKLDMALRLINPGRKKCLARKYCCCSSEGFV